MAKIEVKKVTAKINPKNLVKIGRLKQVADSLASSADYKKSAVKYMTPNFGEDDEKVIELYKTGREDSDNAKRYRGIIDKAEKKLKK